MKQVYNADKLAFSVIIGAVVSFLGGFDILLQTLLIFIVIDYLTGLIKAGLEHKLSSKIGFKGIVKKIMMIILVGVAFQLDKTFNTEQLRNMVVAFYIANEGLSILENSIKLGLPIPEKVKIILEELRNK
jgi:toxin secretion/phage lysis holin